MSGDTPTLPDRKACASCGKEFTGGETTCSDDGTPLTSIRREGLSGTVAGKYEILSSLGDGGWGTVYKAQHILLQRPVAIKTLHRHMVESGSALKRFKQEALAGSQLDHPHILNVLDFGITDDGVPYIVMDYLEGASLAETLDAGGFMEPRRAMKIFSQVASALAHAHRNGVIHRDLKPANIMLVEHDGVPDYVKIVDFGIAKIVKEDSDETSQLTETGQLFGSPLYMSPEQCTGKNLDGRSDIYSLGCVMYRTLTGQPAFHVRDLPDCIYKHVNETPAAFEYVCPDRPIPAEVETIVFKCLLKNPNNRYQTMTELDDAIKAWLDGKPLPIHSATAEGETAGGVTDTTTRITAMTPEMVAQMSQSGQNTVSGQNATVPPEVEQTLSPMTHVSIHTNASTTADEKHTVHINYVIALVATSLIVLLPVGYFFAKRTQNSVGPVNTKLVQTAAQGEKQPNSAAQKMTTDKNLSDGIDLFNNGKYGRALKVFSSLAAAAKNPDASEAKLWQAMTMNETFLYADAKASLLRYIKLVDEKGVNAARALNALGYACSNMGDIDEAQGYYDRARNLTEKFTGPDSVVHAQMLRGSAELALNKKQYKRAAQMLTTALAIDTKYGAPELEIAFVQNDLGQTYDYMGQYDKARECYDNALVMRQDKLKGSNPLIAYTYECIASVDYQQKKLADSERRMRQSLSILKQNLSDDYTETQKAEFKRRCIRLYTSLAAVNIAEKDYPDAINCYQRAIAMLTDAGRGDGPEVADARMRIAALEHQIHQRRR